MFKRGGIRPFFVGSSATLARDIIFGGTYALLRHELQLTWLPNKAISMVPSTTTYTATCNSNSISNNSTSKLTLDQKLMRERRFEAIRFLINMYSACMATFLSSPFNYVRNVHYSTPPEHIPLTTIAIFTDLIRAMRLEKGYINKCIYVLKQLRIGWGTARVGVGMAFGSEFYYYCSQYMK